MNRGDALKKQRQRLVWIANWIQENGDTDILNKEFVDDYIAQFKPAVAYQPFGAHKCPQLSKDLGHMNKLGYLKRSTTGIGEGFSSMGFPKWVYSYRLGKYSHLLIE